MSNSAVSVKTVWQAVVNMLKEANIDTPVADARLLVQHAVGMTHEELLLRGSAEITNDHQAVLEKLVERRLKREPVSRIVGRRAFWKADFIVTPDTLDPRADSETLIEAAMAHVKTSPEKILDIGTGTGCLLLSLLHEWQNAKGTGIDISTGAVEVSRRNATVLGFDERASFEVAGWADYQPSELFDVVVSNPPYIAPEEAVGLMPEVALYDPPQALFAPEGGLAAYREIVNRLPLLLKSGGWLFFEIGYRQAESVKDILAKGGLTVLETRHDLGGNPRVLVARFDRLRSV